MQAATYPGGAESAYPLVESIDLTQETTMTAAAATAYASWVYYYRQSNKYSGEVGVLQTAHDEHGIDVPTYRLKPGDRITAIGRDDTDRFGETLYVQQTSYDWQTETGRATIGTPFDPLDEGVNGAKLFGRNAKPYKVRT